MKKNETITLWLYLARKDKKGIKILAKLMSRELYPTVIENVSQLGLPSSWEVKINEYIESQGKIYWDVYIQTAKTFDDLKSNLKKRGYSDIPINGNPMILILPQFLINVNLFPKQKTMIRKI